MKRWVSPLPLLATCILMLAIAIAISTPAAALLRVNAATTLQAFKAKVQLPTWIAGASARLYHAGSRIGVLNSPALSVSTTASGTISGTSSSPQVAEQRDQRVDHLQTRLVSSIAIPSSMASSDPPPADCTARSCAPGQKATALPSSNNADTAPAEPELPKLSAQDFRVYNRLAVMMDAYHNHFRYTWNLLYKACTSGSRPDGMSLRSFVSQGLHLCHALTIHHTIEEQHVFPELAERMPAFGAHDHLITQHEQIHEGLEKLEEYLDACRSGEKELRLPELKAIMDSFGGVLWAHLDDEVRMLGAENMRKYWSKDEIMAMQW